MHLHVLQETETTRSIPLSQGRFAVVDAADYSALAQHKWCYSAGAGGYAARGVNGTTVLMHRAILQAPKGMQVDHINGDRLDNRRCNLRLATPQENRRNRHARVGASRYKGVSASGHCWRTSITVNYKTIHIGHFKTETEAARAYNQAATHHFGEFAQLNSIDEDEVR